MLYSLRQANDNDLEFLRRLRDQTMRTYLLHASMPVTREAYDKRILAEFDSAMIVEVEGQPVGLFKAIYESDSNHWQLMQIQLLPKMQGKGIGESLIRRLIQTAKAMGATVGLRVIDSNPAFRLYKRLGFEQVTCEGSEYLMLLKPE